MKSVLGTRKRIRKDVSIDPISSIDEKLIYIAYRLGKLPNAWRSEPGISVSEFSSTVRAFILQNHDYAWSLRRNGEPKGIVFGVDAGATVVIGDVIWHPKTTVREKLELSAALGESLRKDNVAIIRSSYEHKHFYETLCSWRILRRVGTLYDVPESGQRSLEYQTRGI